MKAMLYGEIDEARLDWFLGSPTHVAEQKMDGARVVARVVDGQVMFFQRGGEPLKFAAAALHLPALREEVAEVLAVGRASDAARYALDGELIISTGEYHVFDLIDLQEPGMSYQMRRNLLQLRVEDGRRERVRTVRMHLGRKGKADLIERVRVGGGEGVMLKDLRAPYEPGGRVRHSVKFKFVKSADVVVLDFVRGRNEAGREVGSATLGVLATDREQFEKDVYLPLLGRPFRPVGACSLIGKPEVEVGDVVEINYLYWTGTSVYQPRLMRTRPDKDALECGLGQFQPYSRDIF